MDISSLRSSPRIAAPVALGIFAIALLLVVVTSGGSGSGTPVTRASVEKQRDLGVAQFSRQSGGGGSQAAQSPSYSVKSGDTLSSISQKTGISVSRLQQLNPSIDPQALATGEKLKLK